MTILMILSNYPDKKNPIAGIFYKRIAEELIQKGFNIIIISPKPFIINNIKLSKRSFDNGIKICRPVYFPFPSFISKRIKLKILQKVVLNEIIKENLVFDIIDSRYAFPWCYIGTVISQKYKKPLVSTFIGSDINTDIFESKFIFNKVKDVINQSAKIITVSYALKQVLSKEYSYERTEVIYDGIDFKKIQLKGNDKKNIFGYLKGDKLTIGFVGQLSEAKGCDILLQIIEKTQDKYNWILIGNGPFFKMFGKFKNVHLTGAIPPEEVFYFYKQMDLFVFPSKNEGIPNVLKEAAFFKVPIIASAVGGIPELTKDGFFATLIDDYNLAERYIRAIEEFVKDKKLYQEKAVKFHEYVLRVFNIEVNTTKLVNLYKRIVNN